MQIQNKRALQLLPAHLTRINHVTYVVSDSVSYTGVHIRKPDTERGLPEYPKDLT